MIYRNKIVSEMFYKINNNNINKIYFLKLSRVLISIPLSDVCF